MKYYFYFILKILINQTAKLSKLANTITILKMTTRESTLVLKHQRERVAMEYLHEEENLAQDGKLLVYPNQKNAAFEVLNHYENNKYLVLLVAQPGTGKTGTVLEVLKQQTTHIDDEKCIVTKDIHVISGMNDKDWLHQFQNKMLPSFSENIYHRSILKKHTNHIADIRNGMLITDECHIASGKSMTVSNVLRETSLTNFNVVKARKVRLFDISATPESVAWDIKAWGEHAAVVRLLPGPLYKGFEIMLAEERIREAKPFDTYENVREWFELFQNRYNGVGKKYFPVRVSNLEWIARIRIASSEFDWDEKRHDSESRIEEIDKMMAHAPAKHTIILIKEFWRASKRLVRLHVGGSYEQVPITRNVTTASQSTIGRFCDNFEYEGDELNPDLRPVHFGDKKSIEDYIEWFNKGCDFREVDYSSTRIKSFNGNVKAQASKVHISNIKNLDAIAVPNFDPNLHKRVPIVLQVMPEIINQLKIKKDRWINLKNLLSSELHEDGFEEFREIITRYRYFQFSAPRDITSRSYKIHITDVVNAYEENRKYAMMDMTEEYKKLSCWQVYMDEHNNRLCILWQVFPEHPAEELEN